VQEKIQANKKTKSSKTVAQVLLDTEYDNLEDEDNLQQAFGGDELHLDFAHSIAMGYAKERYYLLFVVGGKNFMWATPTTTRMEPEELLRDFLTVTGLKIGKL
jgi:hypothetical protein